ncbi:alpha-1,2-fucosyltransferase [Sulfurimonas indica]|uniref:alpha-1,2-fucosyltransferase n=1 Tax=Sulfurimonas indica TaxID=2508707 RepID=UPI0012652EA0|nr:alpha-1,2-fucosyltransferase [Sulfurimonas indica]
MIITKITGGLGNQMFQYAIAKSIALKNHDKFLLDISFYAKQSLRKYELNLFNIEEHFAKPESFLSKVTRKIGFVSKGYYIEKEIAVFDKSVFEYDNIILDGYWQNEKYFKDIRESILKDFTPKKELSHNVKEEYLDIIKGCNSISIHIRRGDYLEKGTNEIHGVCDLLYYKKAIELLEQKIDNPKFFIFSDDISWCKDNLSFLNNPIFIDKTKSAIEDLELMKHCKHNIIANSTFSWWGAWLNENEEKNVIAPKRWFIDKEMNNQSIDIVPSKWKRI